MFENYFQLNLLSISIRMPSQILFFNLAVRSCRKPRLSWTIVFQDVVEIA
jgi:hypothetical protein